MFSEELEKISWDETTERINAKTDADVRRALAKEHCDVEDFMALVSPAAAPYLEIMARLSRKYTEERFGKTISALQADRGRFGFMFSPIAKGNVAACCFGARLNRFARGSHLPFISAGSAA